MAALHLGKSRIENRAGQAASLDSLGGFNLRVARKTLGEMLAAIGNTAEFSTYTKHDITHIDALLECADWIIPESAWHKLTVADALVIVLSIYVHDLGMLVTDAEYRNRESSEFPQFRDSILADETSRGIDFRDRLAAFGEGEREHFLYEEFVRLHHAERIESWVSGKDHARLGASDEAASLVSEVFRDLHPVIRNDIALVARSHHLDDLDDLTKYKVNRAYGGNEQDVANLQYAAVVLRTVDLLHMTRDRTPVVQFRLASPTDPVGQREWHKQQAVRAVKPRISGALQPDVIEVHATFGMAEGFFALMDYLDYCEQQLTASRGWIDATILKEPHLEHYAFPWRTIERDQIEAEGFNRRQFAFSFDQQKVLELLTGHTLYNDASVAVREIVQNAIDAVRLSKVHSAGQSPDILVTFDSSSRVLRVIDHGTGMSQQTIEEHFLKVGSSGYQTKEFRETHPDFTSISRFGIGVLSAFMIADEVRVATITRSETTGRELVLKSVHGRYLIKDFSADSECGRRIGQHGTEIELKLRASSGLEQDITGLLRRWVIIPRCTIECVEDGRDAVNIGAPNVQVALKNMLDMRAQVDRSVRVVDFHTGDVSIALAQTWNPTYKEWEVLRFGRGAALNADSHDREERGKTPISGVSVQGIRVTESVPGFRENGPVILIDVQGQDSPATNVARTDLEAGPQYESMIRAAYSALVSSIEDQISDISARGTLRLALKEVGHLYVAATNGEGNYTYTKPSLMESVLSKAAVHPVEIDGALRALSASELRDVGFSVLIGPAAEDAARFLDWLPKPKGLLNVLNDGGLLTDIEDGSVPLLGGQQALFAYHDLLWNSFDVTSVRLLEGETSLFIKLEAGSGRWAREWPLPQGGFALYRQIQEHFERGRSRYVSSYSNMYGMDVSLDNVGMGDLDAIFIGRNRIWLPHTQSAALHRRILGRVRGASDDGAVGELVTLFAVGDWLGTYKVSEEIDDKRIAALDAWLDLPAHRQWPERESIRLIAQSVAMMRSWSPSSAWLRRGDSEGE